MKAWPMVAALLLFAPVANAQEPAPLDRVRDLYYSAAFTEALDVLETLRATGDDSFRVEEYRAACLMALGRELDARRAIAALVRVHPERQSGLLAESPATKSLYESIRAEVLSDLIRDYYVAGTKALDAGHTAEAAGHFDAVLRLFDDLPDDAARQLSDFSVLSAEFLSAAAVQQAAADDPQRAYTAADAGVVAPTVIRQQVPTPPGEPDVDFSGTALLEIWISATGAVERANLQRGIHPAYDALILAATRTWQYAPASVHGRPVRFRKLLQIDVR